MKLQKLVQTSLFEEKNITFLRSTHFEAPTKQILIVLQTRLEKSLIWQKSSVTCLKSPT